MIPILYESNEQDFTSNGIGRLVDCVRCEVTEERNGIYEVEFDYPVSGRLYDEIIEGRIISVTHDDTKTRQPFIIYRRSAPIDGLVTFNAHHVSYNLSHCILQPFTASSVSDAFSQMASRSITPCNFTFWTDKATGGNFAVDVPISIKEILGGIEGSILDVFGGGEYEWDKYTVKLYQNRGTDSGVTIRYGKNLTDLTQERDTSGMYNAVIPYWTNGEQTVTLGTEIVKMSGVTDPVAVPLDMSSDFQDAPTTTQLKNAAQSKLNNSGAWSPDETITVDFVQLWQTDEYSDVAVLQRVKLCDTVTVIHPALGLTAQAKVVKVVYNALLDKYDSMELGNAKTSFADTIAKSIESSIVKNVPSVGMMQAAIDHATQLITGGLGGYVVFTFNADGEPQEMLIMDTDNVQTAVNVIRINKNGIGFSTRGYNGPFTSAWTIDGHFNADFITAGHISANYILGGILKLGGSGNGNGVLEIYNSSGVRIGKIDNTGAAVSGNLEIQNILWSNASNGQMAYYKFELVDISSASTHPFSREFVAMGALNEYGSNSDLNVLRLYAKIDGSSNPYVSSLYLLPTVNGGGILTYKRMTSNNNYNTISRIDVFDYNYRYNNVTYSGRRETRTHVSESGYTLQVIDTNDDNNYAEFYIHVNSRTATPEIAYWTRDDHYVLKVTASALQWMGQTIASSSSRRYKHSIKDITDEALDPKKLYNLPVRQFVYNDDYEYLQYQDMKGQTLPGFIAEEVAEIYPSAVIHHPKTGEIESWDERRIIPGMLALIQEQKKEIDELKDRIEKLEKLVNKALEVAE